MITDRVLYKNRMKDNMPKEWEIGKVVTIHKKGTNINVKIIEI